MNNAGTTGTPMNNGDTHRTTGNNGDTHRTTPIEQRSEYLTGKDFAQAVRQHWSVENNCHWQLDVLFRENDSRVRERTLANNLS